MTNEDGRRLRHSALDHAMQLAGMNAGQHPSAVIEAAKAFEAYLRGDDAAPKEDANG